MAVPRVDRRLAAIMALDVVGYSRLIGADEAGTLARVKAHRIELAEPLIAEHHGRVVKLTGDGALVEFASAVDAVECALAIQGGMAEREAAETEDRRIRFRIGINIGDIILEDGDIYGDGVNIASRLEGLTQPGGICIARNVYDQVKNKLDLGFEPMGEHRVKNIAEPLTVYRVLANAGAVTRAIGLKRPGILKQRWAALAAAVVVIAAGGAAWWSWSGVVPEEQRITSEGDTEAKPSLPLLAKPSIAVLPFANLSGPEQNHIGDGLAEDLITDLSKLRGLTVIARTSSFALRGEPLDAPEIGRRLDARFVVEGSVRKVSDRIRVTVQLIDTATGAQRWAERWDRPASDILAVQDELTREIVARLDIQLSEGEQANRWRRQTDDPIAYDLFLRGRSRKLEESKDGILAAIPLLKQAVERDPNFAAAWVWLGWAYWAHVYSGWTDRPDEYRQKAINAAQRAIAADPGFGGPYALLADIAGVDGELEDAEKYALKAVELDPGSADNLAFLAGWSRTTRPEQAFDLIQRAFRLNPIPPTWYFNALGMTQLELGRYAEAAEAFDKCIAQAPEFTSCRQYLIAAQLEMKDLEAAKRTADGLLRLMPDFSIAKDAYWYKQTTDPAEASRRFELLREARLPP
jgi:adenylate cyclase